MSIFKFKQFEVSQQGCGMKINTDGVLLAAMVEAQNPSSILDVGTGTGVIALMLAQQFQNAKIQAVEIDSDASVTAGRNFSCSPFGDRLAVENVAIENYESSHLFDLIVTNPPFFVNDLKNQEEKKGMARHTNHEFFDELMRKVAALLCEEGSFWFVLPLKQASVLIDYGAGYGFSVKDQIYLRSDQSKPPFRTIVSLSRGGQSANSRDFFIYEREKVYTQEYKRLLKDFFLDY